MAEIRGIHSGLWVVETGVEDFDVRSVVVAGSTAAVVFDTLARPRDMRGVAELAPGLPITIVYSHGDWDHVWGTAGLSRSWAEVLAHDVCLPRFNHEIPATLAEKQAENPSEFHRVELIPPTRTFPDRTLLDLGGITLELHHLPGHTPDSVVGFIPEWGVFLAGDAVETPLPFLNEGSPAEVWARGLEGWLATLEVWMERSPDRAEALYPPSPRVIPSHGPMGGPELLANNVRYLRALLKGEDPVLPAELSPFYAQTHAVNRHRVGNP